jgi:hypothetical protein
LHIALTIALPILLYIFVRIDLPQLAIVTVVLSKWRMFAVRPRYWLANIQANGVDILVAVSIIVFMTQTTMQAWQLVWAGAYAFWLLVVKPANSLFGTSAQAMIAQIMGLMAIYTAWSGISLPLLVFVTWLVCYVAARHFFTAFDEPLTKFLTSTWALFGASLAWLSGHWLLYYGAVAQPTLLLVLISFTLATMYYLHRTGRLTSLLKRQLLFIMLAVIVVVLVFSDWGDKAV